MPSKYYRMNRPEMLQFIPESAEMVLEVGCGEGTFSQQLAKDGRRIWGIEPQEEAAAVARSRLDYVYVGSVENAIVALAGNVFDCIVFNDVLEHLLAPWDVLRDVAATLLSDGGAIVASIPNIRHYSVIKSLWLEGDWRYEEAGILDRTHLRFFTRKTIGELFRNAGYKVVALQGITIDGVPRKMRLLSKYLCRQPEDLAYKQFAVLAIKLPQS